MDAGNKIKGDNGELSLSWVLVNMKKGKSSQKDISDEEELDTEIKQ